jgi:prophage regulatory protein
MKLLDRKALQERGIRYSPEHLWRLWTTGKFPRPMKLSRSRNAWLESEIDAWLEARVADRDAANGASKAA